MFPREFSVNLLSGCLIFVLLVSEYLVNLVDASLEEFGRGSLYIIVEGVCTNLADIELY
jgi:Ca2+/H+ antiporter